MKIYPYYASGDFLTSYLVCNETCKEALIIDPGRITADLIDRIEHNGYRLTGSCMTHYYLPYYAHTLSTLLKIYHLAVYAADETLATGHETVLEGDRTIFIAGFSVTCFSIFGHYPRSYLFKIENCLFTGSGVTEDGAGGMMQSGKACVLPDPIEKKLKSYGDELVILPGSGPPSTLGVERRFMYR